LAQRRFSPVQAALEGFRVLRREPQAVLYWLAVWAIALAVIGAIKAAGGGPATHTPARDTVSLIRSYGPFATILVPLLLALWVMNTATVYRAVLRPGEHGWHLFKLGSDEARIAVVSFCGMVLVAVFGSFPTYLLFVLFSPIFEAAPGHNREIALAGAFTTIVLDVWIVIRFSLAAVQTFAEERFPVADHWGFTRGYAWRLFVAYVLVVLEMLLVLVVLALVGGWVLGALVQLVGAWRGPDLLRRALLIGLVPFVALQAAAFSVALSLLLGGCQAYAYGAIRDARAAVKAAAA
jgi:hypothetical protein